MLRDGKQSVPLKALSKRAAMPSDASWSGTARLGLGWGLFVGRAGDNHPHAHHAVQIVLSKSPQSLWTAAHGWQSCRGAIIGADVQHRLEQSTEPVTLIYVEPDSIEGRTLASHISSGLWEIPEELIDTVLAEMQVSAVNPLSSVVRCLFPTLPHQTGLPRDTVIEALIDGLPKKLPVGFGISLLAERARLSPSRLQHRFRNHTGLAVRPYLRWRRLLTAMDGIGQGLALTTAAYDSGFSDAAHFSRTFRRHFGISPSVLLNLEV